MNKQQLVEAVQAKTKNPVPKALVEDVLDALAQAITESICSNDKVSLPNIGHFTLATRKPRIGRNPKTGSSLNIVAKSVPKFSFAKPLKDACMAAVPE